MMNKRALRKFAVPERKLNLHSGLFCAGQIQYVVCTAIKNIAHRRTLVLYVYDKENLSAGDPTPRWTMFQTKDGYLTLHRDEKGTRWLRSMFENLDRDYYYRSKCAFYSLTDEQRVTRYCQTDGRKGFDSLSAVQRELLYQRQKANERKGQQRIVERMKPVKALPRDIKGFLHRETLPYYIFYDYVKGKKPANAYCTACRHEVTVEKAKHNDKGVCPRCKREITYKSRGKRGYLIDRSTAQVIQRTGENELVIRFIKAYCRYPKRDVPEFSVYENARLFLRWEAEKLVNRESYYYCYSYGRLTPWRKGERPVFSRWQYNFEADGCGYLYHRNLEIELKGTPWQYSALREYYAGDPTPLYVAQYLQEYLHYPMLEYLVKLKLYRLATYVVYGDADGSRFYGDKVLNSNGKSVDEVLGVERRYISFLQKINPGGKQLRLIKSFLREHIEPDLELMKWCSDNSVGDEEQLLVPLRYMTPHKLTRYAAEQFAAHRKTSYAAPGYYSVSSLLSDYKDYLCMSEALEHDMKSSFVLFPNNLKEAHDRVNDMTEAEISKECDRKIAKMYALLKNRYGYEKYGFVVVPPHSAKEIAQEGDKLHHCVGRYVKSVVKNDCVILFIRKADEPETPYCTVELKNDAIVQARIQNNGNPPPEVEKFIALWKQQVLYASAAAA